MNEVNRELLKIVIMASGEGTNAMNIVTFFKQSAEARVVMILTNNSKAGVIDRARHEGVPCNVLSTETISDGDKLIGKLHELGANLVILAGYLKLLPQAVVKAFQGRIINIHPALLPEFGGKGMYGSKVHESVIAAGKKKSGITIHLVNEFYDQGEILFQEELEILPGWNAAKLQEEIHQLEYRFFPSIIQKYIRSIHTF